MCCDAEEMSIIGNICEGIFACCCCYWWFAIREEKPPKLPERIKQVNSSKNIERENVSLENGVDIQRMLRDEPHPKLTSKNLKELSQNQSSLNLVKRSEVLTQISVINTNKVVLQERNSFDSQYPNPPILNINTLPVEITTTPLVPNIPNLDLNALYNKTQIVLQALHAEPVKELKSPHRNGLLRPLSLNNISKTKQNELIDMLVNKHKTRNNLQIKSKKSPSVISEKLTSNHSMKTPRQFLMKQSEKFIIDG